MLKIIKNFLLLIMLLVTASIAAAQTPEEESDLKAVFIYNFTRYVEWNSNPNENEFVVGVLGSSPIIKPFSEIAKTNTVSNKKIIIKRFAKPEDISNCHVLFIPHDCPYPVQNILDKVEKGVLTVSEEPGLAKMGTAFNFVLLSDKLKFEANLRAINAAGLKVSSQLLKLAIIVN